MDQVELSVRPAEGGWKIESSDGVEPLMFLSGGRAEVVGQERFEPA
jgi:hypothetical protein